MTYLLYTSCWHFKDIIHLFRRLFQEIGQFLQSFCSVNYSIMELSNIPHLCVVAHDNSKNNSNTKTLRSNFSVSASIPITNWTDIMQQNAY